MHVLPIKFYQIQFKIANSSYISCQIQGNERVHLFGSRNFPLYVFQNLEIKLIAHELAEKSKWEIESCQDFPRKLVNRCEQSTTQHEQILATNEWFLLFSFKPNNPKSMRKFTIAYFGPNRQLLIVLLHVKLLKLIFWYEDITNTD